MQELECIEVNKKNPKACIIWLHGLGADGEDFLPLVEELRLPNINDIKFVFPSALFRPISVNNGISMRAWFDLLDLGINRTEDEFGITQSLKVISNIIQKEIDNGIPADKIIIGGFSQGGAMAIYTGLRFKEKLGGVVVFSGYCPLIKSLDNDILSMHKDLPIYQTHGLFDPIVPLHVGKSGFEFLEKHKLNIRFKTYPIQHTVSAEEIADLANEINSMLKLESVK